MRTKGFPKYFLYDNEIFVKVYFKDMVLVAINDLGSTFQPYRAMGGREITKQGFETGSAQRKREFLQLHRGF